MGKLQFRKAVTENHSLSASTPAHFSAAHIQSPFLHEHGRDDSGYSNTNSSTLVEKGQSIMEKDLLDQTGKKSRASKTVFTDDSRHSQLLPLRVLGQYKVWHSQQALLEKSKVERRKYAVAYYSCPMQAGNRLHHFMNAIIWGMVTNRTILWKYYDKKTCLNVSRGMYDGRICMAANTEADCNKTLQRASWLPSLDEWAPKLFGNDTVIRPLSVWSTTIPFNMERARTRRVQPWKEGYEKYRNVDILSDEIVDFGQMLGQDAGNTLRRRKPRELLLHSNFSRSVAEQLTSLGADFLYGMVSTNHCSESSSFPAYIALTPCLAVS